VVAVDAVFIRATLKNQRFGLIVQARYCNPFGGDVGKPMEAFSDRLPELSATGPVFLRPGMLLSYPFPISCLPSILKKRWQVIDSQPGRTFLLQNIVVISQQHDFRCLRDFHNVASKLTFNGVSANFCSRNQSPFNNRRNMKGDNQFRRHLQVRLGGGIAMPSTMY